MNKRDFEVNNLNDFVGQQNLTKQLKVYIFSAKKRQDSLDHILFYGPPGLGKTTLARILAKEMEVPILQVSAPTIEKISDLLSIVSQIKPNSILFLDEIHRLAPEIEEVMYEVMESFKLSIVYKTQSESKTIKFDVPKFTLIGATTQAGNLSFPLRTRFSIIYRFKFYEFEEMKQICLQNSKKLNLNLKEDIIKEIASKSRNTPRTLNNILKRLADYCLFNKISEIKQETLITFFSFLGIYENGINEEDLAFIKTLKENYKNVPTSIESIAASLNENPTNLRNINEPFLVKNGIIARGKRGRYLTEKGLEIYRKISENEVHY